MKINREMKVKKKLIETMLRENGWLWRMGASPSEQSSLKGVFPLSDFLSQFCYEVALLSLSGLNQLPPGKMYAVKFVPASIFQYA